MTKLQFLIVADFNNIIATAIRRRLIASFKNAVLQVHRFADVC